MHTQERERERFARCPDPAADPLGGQRGEEEEQEKSKSSRRDGLQLGRLARATAMAILSFGAVAYPSWQTLASRAGLSVKEVSRAVGELKEAGLKVISPGPGAERLSNQYVLSAELRAYLEAEREGSYTTATPGHAAQGQPATEPVQEEPAKGADVLGWSGGADEGDRDAADAGGVQEVAPCGVHAAGGGRVGAVGVRAGAPCADREGQGGAGPLAASIRDILSQVAASPVPVELVSAPPRCPALAADEEYCTGTWHHVRSKPGEPNFSRHCTAAAQTPPAQKPARETAAGGVLSKSTLARQVRTPEQHRSAAVARRAAEGLYVAAGEIRVGRHRLADLDAIVERGRDATGAWTTVVGYLFPTVTAADVARRGVT